jgi:hypothetical protein
VRSVLVWVVRLCAVAAWGASAVACTWLLGVSPTPKPWDGPLVWGSVAVGCAVARVLALWALRVWPERLPGDAKGPVSLSKSAKSAKSAKVVKAVKAVVRRGGLDVDDLLELPWDDSALWIKLRTAAVWLLVAFVSGVFFAALMTSPDWGGKVEELRAAGAEVGAATVVEQPRSVREDVDDEDIVRGYSSRLVVAVAGGPERLTVRGAYTDDKPRAGSEVDVLWARSAPDLGGYVNDTKDLATIADGRWKAFPDDGSGGAALFAFIVLTAVFGGVLTPLFTLVPDADDLQELAWSPLAQTVRAALAVGVFWGWHPILLGHDVSVPQMLLAGGGFVLAFLVYVFTSIRSLNP